MGALCCCCYRSSGNQVKDQYSSLVDTSYRDSHISTKPRVEDALLLNDNSALRKCGAENAAGQPLFSDDESDGDYGSSDNLTSDNSDWDENEENPFLDKINPVITIQVPPGPCGILLDDGNQVYPKILFQRLPDGSRGKIELSGKVYEGYVLVGCNEFRFYKKEMRFVREILSRHSQMERSLHFRESHHKYSDL